MGRFDECGILDELLVAVRAGAGGALVLRGAPGIGKTALLDHVRAEASECRVAAVTGVWSERELAFAGLHQLCRPMLDRRDRLAAPQRGALDTAFALSSGGPPDPFLVSLATVSLVSDAARERPLVCLVDDAQWLDHASLIVLAFAARRLANEAVTVVFAIREPMSELAGVPELVVGSLTEPHAGALLDSALCEPMDERVRDRILAEGRGNPRALLELPRAVSTAQLAGGFGLPEAGPLDGPSEERFLQRLADVPADTRLLLLTAAAEPLGDPQLLWSAAERLGITADAAEPATAAGLADFRSIVRFRHPLVRSSVYWTASRSDRQRVHAALAEVTDPEAAPDRRAWHRAGATLEPNEEVAAELERSSGRAQARAGVAAAAAFLRRAVALTPDPAHRTERTLAAAEANGEAGAFDVALELLAFAQTGSLDDLQLARTERLRARIAVISGRGADAPALLVSAARRLEPLDVPLARDTYLDALGAAVDVGDPGIRAVAEAAIAAPPALHPRAADLLLDGLALLITDRAAAGASTLRRALAACRDADVAALPQSCLWLACRAAMSLWDAESWDVLSALQARSAREGGALGLLSTALHTRAQLKVCAGELDDAAVLVDEAETIAENIGCCLTPYGHVALAAWRGDDPDASDPLAPWAVETASGDVPATLSSWATGVRCNGLGRYADAFAAAREASAQAPGALVGSWALVELIEAATRSGNVEFGVDALARLADATRASGTDWALGIEARSRALLSGGDEAERLYREALDRLAATRVRPELARAHLLYGEWLRRERRHCDAREQLRTARDAFRAMGLDAFAERARRELLATGERARKRSCETRDQLTAQEEQVAWLARDGLSNAEIGTRLFISPRTVEYHLTKIFAKLDVSSRSQLESVLPADVDHGALLLAA